MKEARTSQQVEELHRWIDEDPERRLKFEIEQVLISAEVCRTIGLSLGEMAPKRFAEMARRVTFPEVSGDLRQILTPMFDIIKVIAEMYAEASLLDRAESERAGLVLSESEILELAKKARENLERKA